MFAYPFFALTRQQLKTENNKLNTYTQYLMKSTFETMWLFFHRSVRLVELLILYARVQFYMPQASDYRLISKTEKVASTPLSEKTLGSLMFDCLYFSQFWYGMTSLFILNKTLFSYNRLDIFIECPVPVPVDHLTWICKGNCGYSFHLRTLSTVCGD